MRPAGAGDAVLGVAVVGEAVVADEAEGRIRAGGCEAAGGAALIPAEVAGEALDRRPVTGAGDDVDDGAERVLAGQRVDPVAGGDEDAVAARQVGDVADDPRVALLGAGRDRRRQRREPAGLVGALHLPEPSIARERRRRAAAARTRRGRDRLCS